MAEIVSIRGKQIEPLPSEPHAGTIEALEAALAKARTGEIVGVRMAFVRPDRQAGGTIVGFSNYAMLGILYSMAHDLAGEMKEDEH